MGCHILHFSIKKEQIRRLALSVNIPVLAWFPNAGRQLFKKIETSLASSMDRRWKILFK